MKKNKGFTLIELMMVVIIVIIIIAFFLEKAEILYQPTAKPVPNNVALFEYDGCEYIVCSFDGLDWHLSGFTHKGNCKYCQERNNVKLKAEAE